MKQWPYLVYLLCLWSSQAPATITDQAKFFDKTTLSRAHAEIQEIRRVYKSGVDVATYKTIPGIPRSTDMRANDAAFSKWLENRAGQVNPNNILVLAVQSPPYLMVSLGTVLRGRSIFSPNDRNAMIKLLADRFRNEEMNKGLLELLAFVRDTFSNRLEGTSIPTFTERLAAQQLLSQQNSKAGATDSSSLFNWVGLILVLIFGGWLAYNVYQTFVNAKKNPPLQTPLKDSAS